MSREQSWHPVTQVTRLGDQLFLRLAGMIEEGQFREGGRLPAEGDLAQKFGVSRPVIREALGRLRTAGMIVSRKGSGSFVRRRAERKLEIPRLELDHVDSLAQVRKCYDFRVGLEGEAAFNAARNRDTKALRTMRDALSRIDNAIVSGDVGMDADYEFHVAVAQATGNEFYATVMETMRTPIEFCINLARSLALRRPMDHLLRVQQEHVAIFAAIDAGDKEAARRAMRAHIADSCERIFNGPEEARILAGGRFPTAAEAG